MDAGRWGNPPSGVVLRPATLDGPHHQHDTLALPAVQARQLAGHGGLANAVDTRQQDHMGRIQDRFDLPIGP